MNNEDLKKYLYEVKSKVDGTPKIVAAQTKLSKQKYSFSNQSFSEQLIIWDYIWNNSPDEISSADIVSFKDSNVINKSAFSFDTFED